MEIFSQLLLWGVLAYQLHQYSNPDGGSLLNFEKATATLVSNLTTINKYEIKVPIGETNGIPKMIGELCFVEAKGWQVHSLVDVGHYEIIE